MSEKPSPKLSSLERFHNLMNALADDDDLLESEVSETFNAEGWPDDGEVEVARQRLLYRLATIHHSQWGAWKSPDIPVKAKSRRKRAAKSNT